MRKFNVLIIIIISLITLNKKVNYSNPENKYQEIVLYLIHPVIEAETDKYYSTYLKHTPTVYQYHSYTEILEVKKEFDGKYLIKLIVRPVFGPHIQVGEDELTLLVSVGEVEVIEYKHLKSFDLPDRYLDYIKDGYPNPIP